MRFLTFVATCAGCSPANRNKVAKKFLHLCLAVSGVIWVPPIPGPPGVEPPDAAVLLPLSELEVVVVLEGGAATEGAAVAADTAEAAETADAEVVAALTTAAVVAMADLTIWGLFEAAPPETVELGVPVVALGDCTLRIWYWPEIRIKKVILKNS